MRSCGPCWSAARASCCPRIATGRTRATCASGCSMCAPCDASAARWRLMIGSQAGCVDTTGLRVLTEQLVQLLGAGQVLWLVGERHSDRPRVQADCLPDPRDVFAFLQVGPWRPSAAACIHLSLRAKPSPLIACRRTGWARTRRCSTSPTRPSWKSGAATPQLRRHSRRVSSGAPPAPCETWVCKALQTGVEAAGRPGDNLLALRLPQSHMQCATE